MPYSPNTNSTIPIVINRASPYYEKTGLSLSLGDHFSASVNTGMSTKEIDFQYVVSSKIRTKVAYSIRPLNIWTF